LLDFGINVNDVFGESKSFGGDLVSYLFEEEFKILGTLYNFSEQDNILQLLNILNLNNTIIGVINIILQLIQQRLGVNLLIPYHPKHPLKPQMINQSLQYLFIFLKNLKPQLFELPLNSYHHLEGVFAGERLGGRQEGLDLLQALFGEVGLATGEKAHLVYGQD
jgi:hypothetical protein